MTFAMDFQFAGPTNLPYVRGPQPVWPSAHVKAVNAAYDEDCALCLRTALGCGSAPNVDELSRCQSISEKVKSILHKDCTLQARVHSPFPAGAAADQCAALCALEDESQYGSGYARPFVNPSGLVL